MESRNRVGIGLYRTGPPGYIDWQNGFLGIGSWAPQKFKTSCSGLRKGTGGGANPCHKRGGRGHDYETIQYCEQDWGGGGLK
jgi:hypothetical protein